MIDGTSKPAICRRRRESVGLNMGIDPATGKTVARRLLKTQDDLIRSPAIIRAIFGGWRSGKTRGCALAFLANCIANPYREEYGEDRPFSIVIGLTHKVLVDSAYRELKAVIPKKMIWHEVKGASWELTLTNGHIIKFRTAAGTIEGASACGVWLDEAHLLPNEEMYLNYQMRASDALGKRFLVLVSGLPESGWLQDTFDRPEHASDPARLTLFCRTADNHYNPPHLITQFRSSVSKKTAIKYLEGRWMPKEGVIYYEWTPTKYEHGGHLWDYAGLRSEPVHMSVDIGEQGAVLFFQEVRRRCRRFNVQTGLTEITEDLGLHVVDEILPDNASVETSMREAKARGWLVHPDRSIIFVDPTTRPDEFESIRRVFGDQIQIMKKFRGDKAEKVEYGHDCVNAALRDVDGNVRLTCYSGLPRMQRSLLTVINRYHRGPNGKPVRDDKVDHVLDCFRYPVAHFMPLRSPASSHDQRAA